jgi:uncharacterized protein YndB with AHSA1/START domain
VSIAPVVCSVTVKASPERAFEVFTRNIEAWWPVGKTPGENPHVAIVMEPTPDGRWFERDAEGHETNWGKVLTWEPPARVVLGWQLNSQFQYDEAFLTEVELNFTPKEDGKTLVTLEHRNLERFGADAEKIQGQLNGGWPTFMAIFAAYADA